MSTALPDQVARLERLVLGTPEPPSADAGPRPATLSRRSLTPELAAIQNLLCPRRAPISLRAGGVALQAMLNPPATLPEGVVWLAFTLDGHPARIGLSWGQLRRLTGLPLESADPSDAALLIEEALTAWLDDLESQTGLALRLTSLSAPVPDVAMLTLALRAEVVTRSAGAVRLNLPLQLSAAAGRTLAPTLTRWHDRRPDALPLYLRLGVEIDAMRVTMAELAALRTGDALVLPDLPLSGRVIAERRLIAPARPAGDGPMPAAWALTGHFTPRADFLSTTQKHDFDMTENDAERPADAPQPAPTEHAPDSMDGLEMRLSFRLGETLISMTDLRRAGPGTIVTLDRPDGALVDILANGQLIGTGEVITVAGQRAVEIRSLFSDG
ncbi:FliM/FliN family flagellar motor switch protein [Paracoccus laeviglucosivorans]|uniref:Type III secretion protein Q n=1 Tax=Paracoccus laeviglucosivorans TaxID=1197861 RepID=A0A521BDZ7_9RHOB|nr:FliM/FliN family flagellar motor switch protein [Paracoccus laeviglucosivorans]SMO45338.1 type III secretion protein Q [Paracoccus laeviglucosivorans]